MSNLVEISQVKKGYGIKKQVFTDLNLNLESGKIIGLLGPNGSGKTTLIKMLAGLLKPDAGNITIAGKKIGPETKAVVSYLVTELGWTSSHANDVGKLITTLNDGGFFRGGEKTGLQFHYKRWKEIATNK